MTHCESETCRVVESFFPYVLWLRQEAELQFEAGTQRSAEPVSRTRRKVLLLEPNSISEKYAVGVKGYVLATSQRLTDYPPGLWLQGEVSGHKSPEFIYDLQ